MAQAEFVKLYRALNKAQKEAVDSIDGPVMVLAGPGTGKTQILTLRIANILRQTDVGPDAILALTFTTSGAANLRERLVSMIGSAGYRVAINTFHGFCNSIIQSWPASFPHIIGARQIDQVEQIQALESIIDKLKLKYLKPYGDPHFYIRDLSSEIDRLKREDVSPNDLDKLIKVKNKELTNKPELYKVGRYKGELTATHRDDLVAIEKTKELAKVYQAYEKWLRANRRYDYGDMIQEVIRVLSANRDLRLRLQEEFQYLLADEHQDANQSQNRLLELLSDFHDSPNLFIVGDPKQAIYQFQGASLSNFSDFTKRYPKTKVINLDTNYRSTQVILDVAHNLIGHSEALALAEKTKLVSIVKAKNSLKPTIYQLARPADEGRFIAAELKKAITAGAAPDTLAVLYRDNADAGALVAECERLGVPVTIWSDENILADVDIQKLIRLLRYLHYFGDEPRLAEILYLDFLNIDPLDAFRLADYTRRKRVTYAASLADQKHLRAAGITKKSPLFSLAHKLAIWQGMSRNRSLPDCFEHIIHDSGFIDYLLGQPNAVLKLEKLRVFFDTIKSLASAHDHYRLADFIRYLDTSEDYHLSLGGGTVAHQGVNLLTTHKAKGLEFDQVFITGAYDGHWGKRHASKPLAAPVFERAQPAGLDDERRLFYVALTRAKSKLVVTYAAADETGRERLPLSFLSELGEVVAVVKPTNEKDWAAPAGALARRRHTGPRVSDRAFLNQKFLEQGLSVTGLNNYLDCPWHYFFATLLRLPQAQTKHLIYGNAVHAALKEFFDNYRIATLEGRPLPKKQFLQTVFVRELKASSLIGEELATTLARGKAALGGYYDVYRGQWPANVVNELNVQGVRLGDIPLVGKLDKVEIGDDGRTCKVIDYKTSAPKTRNDILGQTKTGSGDYYRQLVFYKLLLDRYERGRYRMTNGRIDFIEPDKKGRYHQEEFAIDDTATKELEATVKKVADEILILKFWPERCKPKRGEVCRWCTLADALTRVDEPLANQDTEEH